MARIFIFFIIFITFISFLFFTNIYSATISVNVLASVTDINGDVKVLRKGDADWSNAKEGGFLLGTRTDAKLNGKEDKRNGNCEWVQSHQNQ